MPTKRKFGSHAADARSVTEECARGDGKEETDALFYIDTKRHRQPKLTVKVARLDFGGGYLLRLSINYVDMSKDMGKRLTQLYYIIMKISYDLGFIAIGVTMAT